MRLSNLSLALTAVYGPTALTIAKLLPSGAGRVAAIYSDPARPSYDECIQKNMDAMGPELLPNTLSAEAWSTYRSEVSVSGGQVTITYTVIPGFPNASQAFTTTGKLLVIRANLVSKTAPGGAQVRVGSGPGLGEYAIFSGLSTLGPHQWLVSAPAGTVHIALGGGESAPGQNSVWSDISVREIDLSKCVLFADAAGQTPVVYPIGAGQGKGLLLDRSAGLVRGPELVVNGGFDTDTDWTKGTGWTIGSGVATKAGGTGSTLTPSAALTPTVSKVYEVVYTITRTAGSVTVSIGAAAGAAKTASGTYTEKLLATTTDNLTISADAAFSGTIDNISVREIPGHHQQQPTAAARGEFSRRYNLLTATDGGSFYSFTGLASYAVAALSPRGDMTARRIIEDTSTGRHQCNTANQTVVAGATYKFSIRARRAVGSRDLAFQVANIGGVAYPSVTVNLETGALVAANPVFSNVKIMAIGGGYWEISFTGVTTTNITAYTYSMRDGAGTEYAGDGESAIDVWGADLRLTADAIPSIPAYQRVTTASDYDETGFPVYWRAVTDDWAKSHMNPNGATKSYVFWAGQKMTDVGAQTVIETSANADTTAGTLGLLFGIGPNRYLGFSRGTIGPVAASVSGAQFDGVHRGAATIAADITSDFLSTSVNGTTAANGADQGTGTYTEQDVFFCARGGTTRFVNIREFAPPLVLFLQPADSLSASHLSKLQRAYAKAAGVTL